LHESEAVDQSNRPYRHENQEREGAEDAESGFARFFGRNQSRQSLPDAPQIPVEEAREAEAARDAAGEDDDLKGVPDDDDDHGNAGKERGGRCVHGRDCTCLR